MNPACAYEYRLLRALANRALVIEHHARESVHDDTTAEQSDAWKEVSFCMAQVRQAVKSVQRALALAYASPADGSPSDRAFVPTNLTMVCVRVDDKGTPLCGHGWNTHSHGACEGIHSFAGDAPCTCPGFVPVDNAELLAFSMLEASSEGPLKWQNAIEVARGFLDLMKTLKAQER